MKQPWPCVMLLLASACAHAGGAPATAATPAAQAALFYERGVRFANEGDLTRAEEYLATAHREGGRDRASLVALLAVCVRASRLRSALAYADPYLHEHPRELPLLLLVASVQLGLGQLEAAEASLEQALDCDDARPEPHFLLARVLTTRAQHARGRAQQSFTRQARTHFARYQALAPQGAYAEEAQAAMRR